MSTCNHFQFVSCIFFSAVNSLFSLIMFTTSLTYKIEHRMCVFFRLCVQNFRVVDSLTFLSPPGFFRNSYRKKVPSLSLSLTARISFTQQRQTTLKIFQLFLSACFILCLSCVYFHFPFLSLQQPTGKLNSSSKREILSSAVKIFIYFFIVIAAHHSRGSLGEKQQIQPPVWMCDRGVAGGNKHNTHTLGQLNSPTIEKNICSNLRLILLSLSS